MAKIAEAFSVIRNGANIKQGLDDSGYPITRIETISNRTVDRNKMGYAGVTDVARYSDYILQDGDILMSHINSEAHLGKVAHYTKQEDEVIIHGMNLLCLRPRKELVDSRFVFYYLSSDAFLRQIPRITKKSVNQASFNVAALKELTMSIPDMKKQYAIVCNLDKVNELISFRKQQLAKLDELIKSRFIEMFGDPIKNTQNRPTTDFINVVMMQRGFDLPVQDRQQDGDIPVYGSNGALDRHNVARVHGGGVITGRSGTIGKVYYTEGDYWPLNTSLFSVDTHGNNIVYLAYLLQMYDLSRFTEGTGVPTLNRNKFHNKPIIDVPLVEQETFATFVEQVDKLKFEIQKSLEKLEILKKALMQEYFG